MASVLPHSAVIRRSTSTYLGDVEVLAAKTVQCVRALPAFRGVYKVTLATDLVLAGLATRTHSPSLATSRALIRRIPFLASLGQTPGAVVELRRIIELTFWSVFFTEHPREWARFQDLSSHAFVHPDAEPLTAAACREPSFYRKYARDLLQSEPSGLAVSAVDRLGVEYGNISEVVHPAKLTSGPRVPPVFELPEEGQMQALGKQFRAVCRDVSIVLAAVTRRRFDNLGPVQRAWFDWLLGSAKAKRLRSGPFGLES